MTEKDIQLIGTKEKFNQILNALQLTDRQYAIFILKYGRAMKQIDIAAELDCSRNIVSNELAIIRYKIGQLDFEKFFNH